MRKSWAEAEKQLKNLWKSLENCRIRDCTVGMALVTFERLQTKRFDERADEL